jgi:hypothetical protein
VTKTYNAKDLFTSTTSKTMLISGTPRFVVPTPLAANDLLVEPESYTDKAGVEHVKGQPLTYYDNASGKNLPYPAGTVGMVVYNSSEAKYQGCPPTKGGVRTVWILNHVTAEHRKTLEEMMARFGHPLRLTVPEFQSIETFCRARFGLGNFYDSDVAYVRSAMSRDGVDVKEGEEYGFLSRKRDVKPALFIPGPCEVLVPSGNQPIGPEGGVLVQLTADTIAPNQLEDIKRGYTLEDGTKLTDPVKQIAHAILPVE